MSDLYKKSKMHLTSKIWKTATVLACARMLINDPIRANDRNRGHEINLDNDIQGILGELISIAKAEDDIQCTKLTHDILSFSGPVDDVDLSMDRMNSRLRLESKCLMWTKNKSRFLVNQRAHEKSKNRLATGYIAIITAKGSSIAYITPIIAAHELEYWNVFDAGYGDPALEMPLTEFSINFLGKDWISIKNDINTKTDQQLRKLIDKTADTVLNNYENIKIELEDILNQTDNQNIRLISEKISSIIE